jgi:hypothetical protein
MRATPVSTGDEKSERGMAVAPRGQAAERIAAVVAGWSLGPGETSIDFVEER